MSTAEQSATSTTAEAARLIYRQIHQQAYRVSATAGMNQRYHQSEAHTYWWYDAFAKIGTAVFAVISAALSIVTALVSNPWFAGLSIVVSIVAAVFALTLNVIPLASWHHKHQELLTNWSDLREEADQLLFSLETDGLTDQSKSRISKLDARLHRLCGSEVLAKQKLWKQCEADELRSRKRPVQNIENQS